MRFILSCLFMFSVCSFPMNHFCSRIRRTRTPTLHGHRYSNRVNNRFWSPSDLMLYMQSPFAAWLETLYQDCPEHEWFQLYGGPDEDKMKTMLSVMGSEAESIFLEKEFSNVKQIVRLNRGDGVAATKAAMNAGADVIYQAPLSAGGFRGIADFVVKVPDGSYQVWDAKLAKHVKPHHAIQLCCYTEMLGNLQNGMYPSMSYVVLNGATRITPLQLSSYLPFYRALKKRFISFHETFDPLVPPELPLFGQSVGRWEGLLQGLLLERDDVSLVAGVGRREADKLKEVGVDTVDSLSKITSEDESSRSVAMEGAVLGRLARQADLQIKSRGSTLPSWEFLDPSSPSRLASLLHDGCVGDVYFDLEGNPFASNMDGSLSSREYLWGVSLHRPEDGEDIFGAQQVVNARGGSYLAWWGHDQQAETDAFCGFMQWLKQRMFKYPSLHVYHYGAYEMSALKRLAGRTGRCEVILDDCLRRGVFVDLYLVLRRNLVVGEPKYSIKNIEKLWRADGRTEGVTKGDDSIVAYKHWIDSDGALDSPELENIRQYNQDDCDSTLEGVAWLRARGCQGRELPQKKANLVVNAEAEETEELVSELLGSGLDENVKKLMACALDFERRELRPMWWRRFSWLSASDAELEGDEHAMCLTRVEQGDIRYTKPYKLRPRKKKLCYTYAFSESQTLSTVALRTIAAKEGGAAGADYSLLLAIVSTLDCEENEDWARETPLRAAVVDIEVSSGTIVVELNPMINPPKSITLIPDEFVNPEPIPTAVTAVARDWLQQASPEGAVYEALAKRPPRLNLPYNPEGLLWAAWPGTKMGSYEDSGVILDAVAKVAENLSEGSYLPIQVQQLSSFVHSSLVVYFKGPPGTGKTTTGAMIVADAVARGQRVAVTANSHKVITNMLTKVAQLLDSRGIESGIVKIGGQYRADAAAIGSAARGAVGASTSKLQSSDLLVGATVWALAHSDLTGTVDLLVVDEAGQVPVSRLPAMGRCLRTGGRLVVLGDQMQLASPLQANHPEEGHLSILEYILSRHCSTESKKGIFLPLTFRLHPKICDFISSHFYNSNLRPHSSNSNRNLKLIGPSERLIRVDSGVVAVPVKHEFNTVTSVEEVSKVVQLVDELLDPNMTLLDHAGVTRPLKLDDILVVSPFNLQVKKLGAALQSARVGTVDKFQGQEAPVVILSLVRSSFEDTPGDVMEFLLDERRMNVALSRAQVCAIVVLSPKLATALPKSLSQMKALSFACRLLEGGH